MFLVFVFSSALILLVLSSNAQFHEEVIVVDKDIHSYLSPNDKVEYKNGIRYDKLEQQTIDHHIEREEEKRDEAQEAESMWAMYLGN